MKRLSIAVAATAALSCVATSAFAYGKDDIWIRVGAVRIDPTGSNNHLAGHDINVDSKRSGAFTLGYRFTDTMGVELLAATESFEHKLQATDPTTGNSINGSARHLPPTLTFQYYPLGGTVSQVQPYVGLGVNYTRFSTTHFGDDSAMELKMRNSWGYAVQAGVDFAIDDHWAANLGVWYMDINSKARLMNKKDGSQIDESRLHIDPIVTMAGVSYRF